MGNMDKNPYLPDKQPYFMGFYPYFMGFPTFPNENLPHLGVVFLQQIFQYLLLNQSKSSR